MWNYHYGHLHVTLHYHHSLRDIQLCQDPELLRPNDGHGRNSQTTGSNWSETGNRRHGYMDMERTAMALNIRMGAEVDLSLVWYLPTFEPSANVS